MFCCIQLPKNNLVICNFWTLEEFNATEPDFRLLTGEYLGPEALEPFNGVLMLCKGYNGSQDERLVMPVQGCFKDCEGKLLLHVAEKEILELFSVLREQHEEACLCRCGFDDENDICILMHFGDED